MASKVPDSSKHFSDFLSNSKSPLSSFSFDLITSAEMKYEILCLPINKAHGLYSCLVQIIKCASDILSDVLSKLFNISMESGKYPSKLKLSKIIPMFKAGDKTDPSNYRPISLLSNFNRL